MRLLRKIENYATVDWSGSYSDNDEVGSRIPSEIEEGSVCAIGFNVRNTSGLTGGPPQIVACWSSTETSTLQKDDTPAIAEVGILGFVGTTNNGGAGIIRAITADDGAELHAIAMQYDIDWTYGVPLPPWVSFVWEQVSTAGTSVVDLYLYGEPRRFSDMTAGGTTTSTSFKP